MGTIYDNLFPLGMGTNRFPVSGVDDAEGIAWAADMVSRALECGVSYIDIAPTYSKGASMQICRLAFQKTAAPKHVTVKSSFLSDQTKEAGLQRVESTFKALEICHASSFVCWNIASWQQFLEITKKGGLYEGAQEAKKRGWVDHICFSSHAPPSEIIRIIESGLFEGVTLSLSPLNYSVMEPVLACAHKHQVGVVVMNPLGGGLIPQQKDYFTFLRHPGDSSTVQAALRYVYAHPAVKIVLSGMSCMEELNENLAAFQTPSSESPEERLQRINRHFSNIQGFCTGCHYCDGCPHGVNIFELMQSYNTTLFPRAKVLYGRVQEDLITDITVCARLKNTFGFLPQSSRNPCVGCGACERKCTAHLPIIQRIRGMYEMFQRRGFSREQMKRRLRELIGDKRTVAFYPGGGYTAYVLDVLKEAFPGERFSLSLYDSSKASWGSVVGGIVVQNPAQLPNANPQLVIISNYNYGAEIYEQLWYLDSIGIQVAMLHTPEDVPWVF